MLFVITWGTDVVILEHIDLPKVGQFNIINRQI